MLIASISANILSLALPLTMKQIYSNVTVNRSIETLNVLILACLVALFLETLLRHVKESSSRWIASKYEFKLNTYYTHMLLNTYLSEQQLKDLNISLQDFSTISKLTSFYATRYYQVLVDIPFMILFFYLIYIIGGILFFVPLATALIYIILMFLNSRGYFKYRTAQLKSEADILNILVESLEKIHFVKASGIENFFIKRYRKAVRESANDDYMLNRYQTFPNIIGSMFSQGTLFAILIVGGYFMLQNRITFGEIAACALIGGRAVSPVQNVMQYYMQHKDFSILNKRLESLSKIFESPQKMLPTFPENIMGRIDIINLEYQAGNNLTKSLSLEITPGSLSVISVKAMLEYKKFIKQLIGKQSVKDGKILIDNLDISMWDMESIHGKIEVLDEKVKLFKGSILDNIVYFDRSKYAQAYDSMALTGLDKLVATMPEGVETLIDSQSENQLSSAFLQRLNLARAFLERPRILIVDRMDENMDIETLEIFLWLLNKIKGHITVIAISDHPGIKQIADIVI